MRRSRTLARLSAIVVLIGIVGAVSWPGQAAPPAVDVIVDNPISLNPNTTNPVTITNPPGTPPSTVNVGNPADVASAIAKAQGIQTPFRAQTTCNPDTLNVSMSCRNDDTAVPNNARVVLEYVGVRCTVVAGAVADFAELIDDTAAVFYPLTVPAAPPAAAKETAPGGVSIGEITFSQVVRLYFDPGAHIGILLEFHGAGINNCSVTFSGQQITQ